MAKEDEEDYESREESAQRLENSRTVIKRWWFNLEDLEELFEEWVEMKEDGRPGWLLVYPGLDKEGFPDVHLELWRKGERCYTGNASHPCPPLCDCD